MAHAADIAKENSVGRFVWPTDELHSRFLRGEIPFFSGAPFTRRYQIEPGVGTAPRTRHNMVQRQVFFGSAKLAFKIIALENILSCQIYPFVRGIDVPV